MLSFSPLSLWPLWVCLGLRGYLMGQSPPGINHGRYGVDPFFLASPPAPDSIVGPDTVCPGTPETFYAETSIPGTIFEWDTVGVDLSPISGSQTSATFSGTGPYQIRVRRRSQTAPYCASPWTSKTVYPPQVDPTLSGPDITCDNSYQDYVSAYADGESYEWFIEPTTLGSVSDGDGTREIEVLWNNVSTPTTAELIVKVRKCGLFYYDTLAVVIQPGPQVNISAPDTVCRDELVLFSTVNVIAPGAGATYEWDFGDGSTAITSGSATHTYTVLDPNNLTFTVTLKVYGGASCPDTSYATHDIVVEPAPVANLTPTGPFVDCGPLSPITLTANAQSGYAPIDTFEWFDANGTVQGPCPTCDTYSASSYGDYYVEVTGPNGCKDRSNTVRIIQDCDTGTCTVSENVSITGGLTSCGTVAFTGTFSGSGVNPAWVAPPQATITLNTANNFEATFEEAGVYQFGYSVGYNVGGGICRIGESITAIVPYLADLKYTVACVGGGYQVTLLDQSNFYPPTPITSYDFYQGTTLLSSGTATTVTTGTLAPGSYTFELIIQGGSFPACTASVTITLPALPDADFTFATDGTCENTPVFFTNNSTGAVSYLWDFDDQSSNTQPDPERVFKPGDLYDVTLTASNAVGCADSVTQTVTISADSLGGILSADNNVCEGLPATLTYVDIGLKLPNTYYWMQGTDTLATTSPGSTYDVFTAGGYWAIGTDANGCIVRTQPATVVNFIEVPDPVISGEPQQCEQVPFTLEGYAGPGIDSYQWLLDDSTIVGETDPTLEVDGLDVGTYDYQVIVEVDGCFDTSEVFTVMVSPLPSVGPITASLISCQPYQVKLDAVGSPGGGSYNWSHGDQGNSVIVDQGGPYQVFYTDLNGCTASDQQYVARDPSAYLWIFPAGCYSFCEDEFPFLLPAPYATFDQWEWWHDGGNSLSGANGFASDYSLTGPGQYVLSLTNDLNCERSSDTMQVTAQACGVPCEEVTFNLYKFEQVGCILYFSGELIGPGGTYTVTTSQGSITPTSGNLNTIQQFNLTLPPGFPGGVVVVTFTVTLPDGSQCTYELQLDAQGCDEVGPCEEDIVFDFYAFSQEGCVLYMEGELFGPGGTYTVSASQGSISPGSGPVNTPQPFVLTLPAGFPGGTIVLTFTVTLPDGSQCIYELEIEADPCEEIEPCENSNFELYDISQEDCFLFFAGEVGGAGNTYTVVPSHGGISPNSGTVGVGQSFTLTLPAGFPGGTVVLTFIVTLPDGSQCTFEYELDASGCEGEDQASRRAKPAVEATSDPLLPSLVLRPNPSYGRLTVDYALETGASETEPSAPLTLTVYNVRGQALQQVLLPKMSGTWRADLSSLPEGLYLVLLRQGHDVIAQRKLSLMR